MDAGINVVLTWLGYLGTLASFHRSHLRSSIWGIIQCAYVCVAAAPHIGRDARMQL